MPKYPLYPTQQNCNPCTEPVYNSCPAPSGTKIEVLKGVPEPKPFSIDVSFSDPFLDNLHGSVYIDPTCPKKYDLVIKGNVEAFTNLSLIKINQTSTANVTATTNNLNDGTKEFVLTTVVPIKVNGINAPVPILPNIGWNFKTPSATEVPVNHFPVIAYAGSGSTAGDVYYTVDLTNFNPAVSSVALKFDAINYDNNTVNINLNSTSPLNLKSASNAISVVGNDTSDTVSFGLRIDSTQPNDLIDPVGIGGLVSYHIPRYFDTTVNTNITSLDSDPLANALPLGAVAVWKNNSLTIPVFIRRISNISPKWQVLNTTLTASPTPTAVATISSNNITVNVPLRINTTLTPVSQPALNGQGYAIQSQNGSLSITDLGNGIIDLTANTTITGIDTSTVDLTVSGTNISAIARLRVNNTTATLPPGSSPVGYNLYSGNSSINITNPTPGDINFELNIAVIDTSTVDLTLTGSSISANLPMRINGSPVSIAGSGPAVGYNILSNTLQITNPSNNDIRIESRSGYTTVQTDAVTGGSTDLAPSGNDMIIVDPTTAYTSNRTRTLQNAGAQNGDTVTFSTLELLNTDIAVNNYIVTAPTGPLFSTPVQLQPDSFYEFTFSSALGHWIRTK
jgi:hypothetical protein